MYINLTKSAVDKLNKSFDSESVQDKIIRVNVFNLKDLITYELASIERDEVTKDDVEITTEYGIHLVYRKALNLFLDGVTIDYKVFEDGESFCFFK